MKPKHFIPQLLSLATLALAPAASAASLVFSATNFNNINQLSVTGSLVDAAHFGADAEADVTVNGITFISRGANSPTLTVGGNGAFGLGLTYAAGTIYQPLTHTVGYTAIAGMTTTQEDLMFDSLVYGPGGNNSLITLNGLIAGQQYQLELLLVNDETATKTISFNNEPTGTVYGPYDYTQNAVQLVTSTFIADSATQQFRIADTGGGAGNASLNAYQLRAIPEPSTCVSLLTGCSLLLVRRRRA